MATKFLDLPGELILHIAELLFSHDQGTMRLLAKRFDHLISPMLFGRLRYLQPSLLFPGLYASLSQDISLGKELVFSHCTKTMIIPVVTAGLYPFDMQLPWLRLLNNLIPTLTNLHSLEWSHWPRKHSVSPFVIDALNSFGSLPNLRNLTITAAITDPFSGFNLKSFSNLSSLSIIWQHTVNITQDFISDVADLLGRCPDLERFTFCIPRPYHPPDAPLLAHILTGLPSTIRLKLKLLDVTGLHVSADDFHVHLRHLFSLKVLRLRFNRHADSPYQNGQICQLLLNNSIDLDELTIDTIHPTGVLDYLSSYSGLEHLEAQSRYPGAEAPQGICRFFSSVLPLHSATLQELHLGWSVETLWTREISPNDLAQIELCQQLRILSCYVTVTIGSTGHTDIFLRPWLETAVKLPRLQHLQFYPTCRYQPQLRKGMFIYYRRTLESEMENEVKKFAVAAVEKLVAGRAFPFETRVLSPTLGP